MFENLRGRFHNVFRTLRGRGVLTEKHLREVHDELRTMLLEADVHHAVVDGFLQRVDEEAIGRELMKSMSPADQYVRIVHEILCEVLGEKNVGLNFGGQSPVVIMCVGLQGSGKTTTVGKLAHWCKAQGRRPLTVPADLARPAAIEQLQALGKEWDFPVFASDSKSTPVKVVDAALDQARAQLYDTVIIDTAGRLHIDDDLMAELVAIRDKAQPAQTILVSDAMAGQQGLVTAQGFHQKTPLTGVIISKADGDARGGVALSCREVLGVPIHFVGVGEKVDAFESFHPDRMASRILDLGDLETLKETVASGTDQETMLERVKKLAHGRFTLEDYRDQIKDMGKMGSLEGLLMMLPGAGKMMPNIDMDRITADLKKKQAVIDSMTLQERANARILNGSRRKRIANGCGLTVTDVNRLIKEFEMMQKMMKKGGRKGRGRGLPPQLMHMMGK